MKIAVCIKQVVTREWQVRVNESKTWVRDADASWELNEPDAYALEEALRLREKHGGEVIAVSAGPARVTQVLREALARGADRAIHVDGEHLATADAFVAAEALAAALSGEQVDLVLTGLQSDDQGFAQVGVVLAEKLNSSHATIIMEVDVQRAIGAARERLANHLLHARRAGRAHHHLAAVLLAQPQALLERIRVRLVHLVTDILVANPGLVVVETRLPLAGRNLLDTDSDFHGREAVRS